MFMRQILADAISKFQKIPRQMLCDKCSKYDVTLIPPANVIWRENYVNPQNADVIWRENYACPQNADVIWRENLPHMGAIILLVQPL
jgi:hypothetical protein